MAALENSSIVQATGRDIDLLSRLIRESVADVANRFGLTPKNCPMHPSNYTREWVEKDLQRGVRYFIRVAGGIAVGCVGVENASQVTCYLERLAVLPQHRRRGYGSHLARYAIDHARDVRASTVSIGIIVADTGLKDFYKALGFESGETKTFPHLPFEVAFMSLRV